MTGSTVTPLFDSVSKIFMKIKKTRRENLRSDGSPTNETPMLLDTSAKRNLLANLCASRRCKLELGSILLDGNNFGTGGGGTNVDHDNLVLRKLVDLGLLAVGRLDTEEAAKEVEVDLDLTVDVGEAALETEDETDKTIGSAEGRVDAGTDTNKTAGNGVLQLVGLRVERHNTAENGRALEITPLVASNDTGADLNLVTELEQTVKNGTTSNTTLKLLNLGTGLVDVERPNDDHVGVHGEISRRDGDGIDDSVVDGVDVELELGRNGDNRRLASDCASDELENRLVVLLGSLFSHKIDLVLENDDLVQLHNLDGGQMLRGLRLRARFVTGNEKKGGVHDGGT